MRKRSLSLGTGSALAALLAIGTAGSASAATLDFTGTLSLRTAPTHTPPFPPLVIAGGGSAQVSADGGMHLLSFAIPGGTFGPVTTIITLPPTSLWVSFEDLWFTGIENRAGSFTGISGTSPGGGSMGLQGLGKTCLLFSNPGTCSAAIVVPLTPTAGGGSGFGLGGTQIDTRFDIAVTMQHAPWTIGQPTMTIHTPNSTISVPALPGGFAHGPASLTSSTAQPSGVVQLVTATKVFTTLTSFVPEFPTIGVLTLHFVPEPATALLLGLGVAGLAALGRRRVRR